LTGGLLNQGLMLFSYGIGTVFMFLAALVVCTTVMSRVIGRYFPEPEIEPVVPQNHPSRAVESDRQRIAAIMAAIHQYRKDKHK